MDLFNPNVLKKNARHWFLHVYWMHLSILLLLLILIHPALAQDSINGSYLEQQLENIAENTMNEETDFTSLLEVLQHYSSHPINLNKTSKEELQQLPFLNDIQINNLLEHLEKNGPLLLLYELQSIRGFDQATIQQIIPYVYVSDAYGSNPFSMQQLFKEGRNTLLVRYGQVLEKQKGFRAIDSLSLLKSKNSRYIGSPQKIYSRYRFTYGNYVSWGITAEKDQGELLLKSRQRFKYSWYEQSLKGKQGSGFDFYSAHLFLKNMRFVKALALGDYRCTFGQGLTVWSGLSFGKSADLLSIKKVASGLSPYTSVDENNFMRGVAGSLRFKKMEVTGFFSHKKIDGNVADTLVDGSATSVSSLQTTGYHSTAGEIADKDALKQTLAGGNLSYKSRKLNLGITAIHFQLDKAYDRRLSNYNQYEFSEKQNLNVGLDYNYVFKNINLFGEQAISKNGGMAFLNGLLISLDKRLTFTLAHRNYQRHYQNLMSNAFAENSKAANEKGTFLGLTLQASKSISLSAYFDQFKFPWLKYQVNAPSAGNDLAVQLNYIPSKKTAVYCRFRQRNKQKNNNDPDATTSSIVPLRQHSFRFNISYTILPSVKLKNRVELTAYQLGNQEQEKGYLVYQDVQIKKKGRPFSLIFRYALFETDSYDSRIYAYENDVYSSYSIPAYAYRGSRFYILLHYQFPKFIDVWLRFSQTYYDQKQVISAGTLAEIQGNTKSEIKVQVRYQF